jgi:hypothetical protein
MIKAGDLVMLIRQPHCGGKNLGWIFRVEGVETRARVECFHCGHIASGRGAWIGPYQWGPLSWLKRIPPIEELERDELVKKLTEPA